MISSNLVYKYFFTFVILMVLLALTFLLAHLDLGRWHTPVGILIAVIKAVFIGLFFMGLRFSDGLHRVFSLCGVFLLLILFSLSLADFMSRDWLALPGNFPP